MGSKVVSGVRGLQAPMVFKDTAYASRVGRSHLYRGALGGGIPIPDPIPEGAVFYAPLASDTADALGAADTFLRATDGWYWDGSAYQVAGNDEPRFEPGGLLRNWVLMETAVTNKCSNYNANPDAGLSGYTTFGDAAGVLLRTDDASALSLAGLGNVAGPLVVELDNSLGATNFRADIDGNTTNIQTHTFSVFARRVSGSNNGILSNNAGTLIQAFSNADYQRIVLSGTPSASTDKLSVEVEAGTVVRFILNQLEQAIAVTSPIITLGAAGVRAVDALEYASASNFVNDAQGMLVFGWRPGYSYNDTPLQTKPNLLGLPGQWVYNERTLGDEAQLRAKAGGGVPKVLIEGGAGWTAGVDYLCALRWKTQSQLGIRESTGWVWGNAPGYNGSMGATGALKLYAEGFAQSYSNLTIYDEDKGTDWIEANYP